MIDLAYIVPAFNAAATIGDTLRSVLAQHGPRVGVVVVDDGSEDSTGDVARATRDWRVEVVRQPNRGLAAARNTGLEALEDRARAVCFLDADDTVEPGHADVLCAAMDGAGGEFDSTSQQAERSEGSELAACGYRMVGPALEDLGWPIDVSAGESRLPRLIEYNPFAVGGIVVRVEALRERAGPRPFDESLPVHEDWDLWLRLSAAGCRWSVVAQHLFSYRLRVGSLSRRVELMWKTGQRVIERAIVDVSAQDAAKAGHAMRLWTIRHLARAAVADAALVPGMLRDLDGRGGRGMDAGDEAAFIGSLRHAFMLENGLGPGSAAQRGSVWRGQARAAMADWPECHAAIDSLAFHDWAAIAQRLARLLTTHAGPDQRGRLSHLRPVIAGMGRNGRALATALSDRRVHFEWVDEDPAARCPVVGARRISVQGIGPRHVVIVTPASGGALFDRLTASRALVMNPGDLLDGSEHASAGDARRRRVA